MSAKITSIMEKLCKFYIGDINTPLCNFRERTGSIVEPSKAEAVGEDGEWDQDFDKCIPADQSRVIPEIIAGQMKCSMYTEDTGESKLEKFGLPTTFINSKNFT